MKRTKGWIFVLCACIGVACTRNGGTPQEIPALRVNTIVVAPQTEGSVVRYVGTVEAAREVSLSIQAPGRVVAVYSRNGDRLLAGDTILSVDSTQAMNALRTARAALVQAQDGYNRVRQVHVKGAVTDQKLVEVESQLARAQAMYEAAEQQMAECNLVAPCNGVLNGLTVEVGQTLVPGARVCTVLDMESFCVKFTVPEKEIGKIQVKGCGGQLKGEVECAAVNEVYPVTITEKSYKANLLAHTYEVLARIKGGARELMPGMVAIVRLRTGCSEDSEVVIPAKCILLKPQGPTVWVKENGRAVRRNVKTDGYQADGVRVTEGLQAGDTLIVDGYHKLYNDCKVIE